LPEVGVLCGRSAADASPRAAGELTLDCDDLVIQGSDLELVVFTAAAGSSSAQALELLGAIGLQRFDVPAT